MSLAGLKIVVTGKFTRSRAEIERALEAAGADVTGSVSGKTHLLICGESAGSKLAKAKKAGVPVVDETQMGALLAGKSLANVLKKASKAPKKGTAKKASKAPKKGTAKKASKASKKSKTRSIDGLWTAAQRKKLHGFLRPHPKDPPDSAPDLATAWRTLRDAHRPRVNARQHATAEAAAALASFRKKDPPNKLDRNEEIARAMILWQGGAVDQWKHWAIPRALVALWHEVAGLDFVVGLLLSTAPFSSYADGVSEAGGSWKTLSVLFGAKERSLFGPFENDSQWEPFWWALRCRFALQSEEEFARSVDKCRRFFRKDPKGKDPSTRAWQGRAALVYAFARETDLAADQIDRYLSQVGEDSYSPGMWIASAPDIERAMRLTQRSSPRRYSIDLVDVFGLDAMPIVQRGFDNRRQTSTLEFLKAERYAIGLMTKWQA